MKTAYRLLKDESNRVGWPTHFVEDLTKHDRNYLSRYKPRKFAWILRPCGTHMIDTPRIYALSTINYEVTNSSPDRYKFYWCDMDRPDLDHRLLSVTDPNYLMELVLTHTGPQLLRTAFEVAGHKYMIQILTSKTKLSVVDQIQSYRQQQIIGPVYYAWMLVSAWYDNPWWGGFSLAPNHNHYPRKSFELFYDPEIWTPRLKE